MPPMALLRPSRAGVRIRACGGACVYARSNGRGRFLCVRSNSSCFLYVRSMTHVTRSIPRIGLTFHSQRGL